MARDTWIDISVPVVSGMAYWPNNPPVVVERTRAIERGDGANVSRLSLGATPATHMDARLHLFDGAVGIDQRKDDGMTDITHGSDELAGQRAQGDVRRRRRLVLGARAIAVMRQWFGGHAHRASPPAVAERKPGQVGGTYHDER